MYRVSSTSDRMSQVVNVKLSRFERQPWGFREGPPLIKTIFFYLANDIFSQLKDKKKQKNLFRGQSLSH